VRREGAFLWSALESFGGVVFWLVSFRWRTVRMYAAERLTQGGVKPLKYFENRYDGFENSPWPLMLMVLLPSIISLAGAFC
jgi:hypothetical protein